VAIVAHKKLSPVLPAQMAGANFAERKELVPMSTLEKAMNLLQEMPKQAIETVYAFMQSILAQQNRRAEPSAAFGIAHKYADPALIEREKGVFQ